MFIIATVWHDLNPSTMIRFAAWVPLACLPMLWFLVWPMSVEPGMAFAFIMLNSIPSSFASYVPYAMLCSLATKAEIAAWMGWLNFFLVVGQLAVFSVITLLTSVIDSQFLALSYSLGIGGILAIPAAAFVGQLRWRDTEPHRKAANQLALEDVAGGTRTVVVDDDGEVPSPSSSSSSSSPSPPPPPSPSPSPSPSSSSSVATSFQPTSPIENRQQYVEISDEDAIVPATSTMSAAMPPPQNDGEAIQAEPKPVLSVLYCNDKQPKAGTVYFHNHPAPRKRQVPVAVVVPCYNEEANELHATLENLLVCQSHPLQDSNHNEMKFHAAIVMDGWGPMSPSMKVYLDSMFQQDGGPIDPQYNPLCLRSAWAQSLEKQRIMYLRAIEIAKKPEQYKDTAQYTDLLQYLTENEVVIKRQDQRGFEFKTEEIRVVYWTARQAIEFFENPETLIIEHLDSHNLVTDTNISLPKYNNEKRRKRSTSGKQPQPPLPPPPPFNLNDAQRDELLRNLEKSGGNADERTFFETATEKATGILNWLGVHSNTTEDHRFVSDLEENDGCKCSGIFGCCRMHSGAAKNKKQRQQLPGPQARNLNLTLIVKRDNRKKHNSHEWFLHDKAGFCKALEPEFALATDCGTLFSRSCIANLVDYMQLNEKCSACAAKQCTKSAEMQSSDKNSDAYSMLGRYLRNVQRYDFESSFIVNMGAFALSGYLPVIPGPCGLYRWSALCTPPSDDELSPSAWYFSVANKDPSETGMVLGNLKIAEDRLLTAAAVFKTKGEWFIGLVPKAKFYYDPELSLRSLVLQRRRWLNGTAAGYVYFTWMEMGLLWHAPIAWYRKLTIFILLLLQFITNMVVLLSPSIFLCSANLAFKWWFPAARYSQVWLDATWIAIVALYVAFVWIHAKQLYIGPLFAAMYMVGLFTIVSTISASFSYLVATGGDPHDLVNVLFYVILAVTFSPMVFGFLADWWSPYYQAISIVQFYTFVPMLVAWFGAYSLARLWDMSWGNRPSGGTQAEIEAEQNKFKQQSYSLTVFVVLVNLFLVLTFAELQTLQCSDVSSFVAPLVTSNPVPQTVLENTVATFSALASGVPAPSVQWERAINDTATFETLANATSGVLLWSATLADSGSYFRALFSNAAGNATSSAALLTVLPSAASNLTAKAFAVSFLSPPSSTAADDLLIACPTVISTYLLAGVLGVFSWIILQLFLSLVYFTAVHLPDRINNRAWQLMDFIGLKFVSNQARPYQSPDDWFWKVADWCHLSSKKAGYDQIADGTDHAQPDVEVVVNLQ